MKKENFKLSAIISLFVIISLSATYAYVEYTSTNAEATGNGGCFEVNYSAQEINNNSLKSTSNYAEGESTDIILSKNGNCQIYTNASIYIYTNSTTTAPISTYEALKYKVVKVNSDGSTTDIEGGTGTITTTGDTLLVENIELTTTATTYTIYLWIDPAISGGNFHGTTYSGYIYASSSQSSTVTGS